MKALTLTQPWASLVAFGAKKIETRSWSTNYRGPLAIHAAKGATTDVIRLTFVEPFKSALNASGYRLFSQLPRGALIATCQLVSVIPVYKITERGFYQWTGSDGRDYRFDLTEQERAFGDYTFGRYAWLLADVDELPTPVPARGALGLWECEL